MESADEKKLANKIKLQVSSEEKGQEAQENKQHVQGLTHSVYSVYVAGMGNTSRGIMKERCRKICLSLKNEETTVIAETTTAVTAMPQN